MIPKTVGELKYPPATSKIQVGISFLSLTGCPTPNSSRFRREVLLTTDRLHLSVEKKLFVKLSDLYINCLNEKMTKAKSTTTPWSRPQTTTPSLTRLPTAAASTTKQTTTALLTKPQPAACQTAQNLTQSFRLKHRSKPLESGEEICDLRAMVRDKPWFRFSGGAGTRLADSCVPPHSCGSDGAIWSNEPFPTIIGSSYAFNAFASWDGSCKYRTIPMSVMRCSDNNDDFIYRSNDSSDWCKSAFCGTI